jgi:Fe-S-cluster containining protein
MTETKKDNCRVEDIFVCARCGYCCRGETTVSLDEDDQQRMAAGLNMEREDVEAQYWRVTGNVVQMKTIDGHCIFFQEGRGCTVHEGRPWRCGQWPLHPSILGDRNNLETIRESCPGLNKELSYEEFCEILRCLLGEGKKLVF